jgi:hypothetical protein
MKKIAIIISFFMLIFCQKNKNETKDIIDKELTNVKKVNATGNPELNKSENAKKWLVEAIEKKLNSDFFEMEDITTKEYAEYKNDAMMADSGEDESLSKDGFESKWKGKFDTKYVNSDGFLISGQDNGKIKVTNCKLLPTNKADEFVFKIIITDLDFKHDYKREIKVIPAKKAFLISDVKEL